MAHLPFCKPLSNFVTNCPISAKFRQGREISITVSKSQKQFPAPRSIHALQTLLIPFYASKDRRNL